MANPIMTTLPAYVEERRLPLIKEAVLGAKSASMFNLQTDIKTDAVINLLSTDVQFGDGLACGWDEQGTQTLSQRTIKTGNFKVNMSYCDKAMLKYWTQYEVRVAAGQKTLPFEEEFIDAVVADVKAKIEKAIWQGDIASGDANLKIFDGLLKIAKADENINKVTVDVAAGAYNAIKAVYMAIPEKVLDGAVIFVGADVYRKFTNELMEKNLFHYDGQGVDEEIYFPGTNVKVVAVNGLNGTDYIFAARPQDLFFGCDMVNDEEKFEFWYSQDNREFRLAIEANAGVQYAFSDQIVLGGKDIA